METTANPLPHWDMSRIYPALDSDAFRAAFESVTSGITALRAQFDREGIRRRDDPRVDAEVAATFEALLERQNRLAEELRTLSAYIRSFVATDSRDDVAQARESELQQDLVELRKLGTRFEAWIGSLDVEALIERSPLAREHAFPLRKAAQAARHQMSEAAIAAIEEEIDKAIQASVKRAADAPIPAPDRLHAGVFHEKA